ncbi:MAG: carbohydrate-binding protein [Gemmatimonadaceae bacterium]|nr:carbohydrate-binding protein [Gemmatimonadaceae bacterium]NUO93520.1 carbohydrate-binding protein [Gemmatimonadaceae bacterium]NUP71764.1 carbohydrate-binding protein [Gemmatimonadaceae bacterium]NUR32690.1 carbohydrate-binding protein [Gemmatimonadaceae bacterium]NUS31899.1 carbohydrate-binding protein [Gemmatimonadaceae bacterium]
MNTTSYRLRFPWQPAPVEEPTEPILGELFGTDRLAQHARQLARRQRTAPPELSHRTWRRRKGSLLARLDATEQVLQRIHANLAHITSEGIGVSPAGDWLLDNYHVVTAQIAEIRTTLPADYYAELPKLAESSTFAGYPRIYEIAIELIAHTDGRLAESTLELMVREYQRVTPLSMGELWAVPAMLRMGFLENIRHMAQRAGRDAADTVEADAWVSRLLAADEEPPPALARALAEFVDQSRELTPTFLTRFLQQMRSRRADFTPLLWLEQWIGEDVMSVEEAVQRSTQRLALSSLVMANSIASLRAIGNIDWRDFVEDTSLAEAILRRDPAGVYATMTFGTRDRYRHVVERLAKRSHLSELEAATAAINAAAAAAGRAGPAALEAHVGYHLVDAGLPALEATVGYRKPIAERLRHIAYAAPSATYLSAVSLLTAGALSILLRPLHGADGFGLLLALGLALVPAADIAVAIVNQLVTLLFPPSRLPRLDFTRQVPATHRTAVVVPILLGSVDAVREALEHLEAQYLANADPEIRFALLGDFLDADQQTMPGDAEIVAAGIEGVQALNASYGESDAATAPFYFFMRPRRLNAVDHRWMGWERKRGKLADFNAWVLGGGGEAFSVTEGELGWLHTVRFVITLDSDTVLPRDAAVTLIGTMAHPLNRARFDETAGRVTRGYGIMQPRVSVSLASANCSRYAAIFAGHPGVDPYTTAVSDVYQDLFAEGTYTGKGIYDVAAFEEATAGRFPENSLLSHDLIEGSFARAALVTDVEVFDDYPTRYLTATRRMHRWIRGDWQLLPWLVSEIPGPRGRGVNPLAPVSRWKMLDNMRRSVTPVLTLAWLVAGWTVLPHAGLGWAGAVLAAFVFPWLAPFAVAALRPPADESWRPYYAALRQDLSSSVQQFAVALVMLPHQAIVAADAIGRTVYRVAVSHRNMLEWQTASQAEQATAGGRAPVWRRMASAVGLGIAALLLMWRHALSHATSPVGWTLLGVLTVCWLLSPEIASALSAPRARTELELGAAERERALGYARAHWRYFQQLATAGTQWLIPDNFQETPVPVVAPRTSPTNIGLQLLAIMSAHDLGFIDTPELIERLERVLATMDRMAKIRGHFMNWYDLADLRVLDPPYVSAVDSGNLAGHLMALAVGCTEVDEAGDAERARLTAIAERARAMAMAMDFRLFYDTRRRLMSIGYDVRTGRLDESAYDLLASEARLASFVAVAKGDVPVEHWFHLGRTLTTAANATALVSWSGSMFEYLMPLLVMASRPFSLLDQTHRAAVQRQIAYAVARGTPWGISESAYNMRDRHDTYQYRAFGVPDLGLKRGLASDVVVAPYATALALAVDPHVAMANLATLETLGALGAYGFYDALDYSRPDPDSTFAVVRAFMAHHVGMSLAALDNVLHLDGGEGIWQRRFMRDPAVRASELLLDERVPRRYTTMPAQPDQPTDAYVRPPRARAVVREYEDADTHEPHVGLLGGRAYCTLLTNAGGGYSRVGAMDVYRWRADATKDETGHFIYLRDLSAGSVWSAAHQPVRAPTSFYRASFAADRAVFTRVDGPVETRTEVVVVPRDRAEIRRVTVCNQSRATRELEITSYGEIVLTDAGADRAHPAFQNLFVETEWLPELGAVLASRRPRSAMEKRPWCAHVLAVGPELTGEITCETDRARFIGRGRTVHAPAALDEGASLSGTAGAVLDPIASLRARLRLEPGRSATVAFTTIVADSREQAIQAVDRYRDLEASRRALSLMGTESQIELRDLDITPADAALYQDLAGALIYPRDSLRAPRAERLANRRGQTALWAHGISGDWPIVLATIRDPNGLPSIRQLLSAHKYWRMKGVRSDLVILNAKGPSYIQDLQDQITTMVVSSSEGGILERPGGVFVRRVDVLPEEDVSMLRATAAIHIVCDGVGLGEIVGATDDQRIVTARPTAVVPRAVRRTRPAPAEGNGFGELTESRDYGIDVDGAHLPPAPWANIVANPNAGFCVTERGGGFTWTDNSFFFRLTPWFNDPVSDPSGEVLYLVDAASGEWWTPTPGPAPAMDDEDPAAYRVVHAPGRSTFAHSRHDVATELELAVPEGDPVKISRLRIRNDGSAVKTLFVTSFVEWVLGTDRQHTRHQLHTSRDDATGAIFAQNFFMEEFASRVAFSWISEPVTSATASRMSFIGRNGDLANPAGLSVINLDDDLLGAGDDPCAALRCSIVLQPGETRELVVLLGAAGSEEEARAIIARCGAPVLAAKATRQAVAAWENRLSTIKVRTPSPEFDALVNRWTLYQALSCRMWARSALYQSSGAYGFRDQLQDGMAFVYTDPAVTREHILRSASHQFVEGDVQHWWHEPSGRGVRTRFSDDLVWLPFTADHYVRVTGDAGVWDEVVHYIEMRQLEPQEHEVYDKPNRSERTDTLYAHCVAALRKACTMGAHGLPLIGIGDWNDGMNRVGVEGKGESVWLAWFLVTTLRRFAVHAEARHDTDMATWCHVKADAYAEAVDHAAWDGSWYRRAYFDDGTPLGSSQSDECTIDSIAQSWAVLSAAGDPERARIAMRSLNEHLVRDDERLILLLTPPFDKTAHDPGYIKGYLPGVRENGAQYTHAAFWTVLATVGLGDGDRAFHLLDLLNPLTHARTREEAERYKVEPYVVAADVYTAPGHVGRGGWTWYTGSASWSYRSALEGILGFAKRGDRLSISPCIPASWEEVSIEYRFGRTTYAITILNPDGVSTGARQVEVDGIAVPDGAIALRDDGAEHVVRVTMGETDAVAVS